LRGRFHWNKHSATGLEKAVQCFQEVLAKDPAFAPAHSGLADYYAALAFYSALPPYELWPKARTEAEAALMLDARLAEAHLSLGYVSLFHDWDRAAAEHRVRLALQLNPGDVNAHLFRSMLLIQEGRLADALVPAKHARDLDPLSPGANSFSVALSVYSGRYDDAIRSATEVLDIEPGNIDLICLLGLAYQHKGLLAKAVETFEKAQGQTGANYLFVGLLGNCYAAAGRPEDARRLLTELQAASQSGYVPYVTRAIISLGLGEIEPALEFLEQSAHARETLVHYLKVFPSFAPVRGHARYEFLLAQLGLSESPVRQFPGTAG
jgi:serine/threonine-protein kinase